MVKKCSKCYNSFDCCNEKEGCWCENVFLDLETLKDLKNTFDNCLCAECLKVYERNNKKAG
jgi:hypothetical protein